MATLQSSSALTPPIGRMCWLAWLLAALLWAPVWGQWHGIAHQARQTGVPVALADAAWVTLAVPVANPDQDSAHTPGSVLCQVLDHLAHASGLTTGLLQLPLASWPALAAPGHLHAGVAQRRVGGAQARAPPLWI